MSSSKSAVGGEPDAAALVAHIRALLRERVAGRRWVVTGDAIQATNRSVRELQELGAEAVFALGASMGTGPLPATEHAVLGTSGGSMMEAIRSSQDALEAAIPAEIQARIDRFDPTGEARALRCLFARDAPVAGRRPWGGRPAAWRALEDKTTVDALWDRLGVPRAASRVVPPEGLLEAHAALDQGAGTVWSLDNREGWHGGASGLRWVRSLAEARRTVDWARAHAELIRVMPFLEGVPCSIHGIVFADRTIALRPCEMVVLRRPGSLRFSYAQAASFWDPQPEDREQMRALAVQVGEWLRTGLGYRGVFTVDGIMSREGFRPTELNPRFGAAIGRLAQSLPALPLYLLHLALVEEATTGVPPADWRPEALEATLLQTADAHRVGSSMQLLPAPAAETRELALVHDGDWREAREGEAAHAKAVHGPAATGSVLLLTLEPEHTPVGPPVAPRVVELFAFLDAHWSLGIGPLEAARPVR